MAPRKQCYEKSKNSAHKELKLSFQVTECSKSHNTLKWQSNLSRNCTAAQTFDPISLNESSYSLKSYLQFLCNFHVSSPFTTSLTTIMIDTLITETLYLKLQRKFCFNFNSLFRCCDCDLRIIGVGESSATDCDGVWWRQL